MNDLRRIALVAGGSRGIGRAIALRLARSGFDIWLTYKSRHEEAQSLQGEIHALGRDCELFAFDVADYQATHDALSQKADATPPHAVVYNAGIAKDNLMVWMTPGEWNDVINVNLNGFFNVVKAVLFPMLREKRGRIVAITSVSGEVGQAGQVNYAASKAGLIGTVKALAREVGKKNILVNAVSPGLIETEMIGHLPVKDIVPHIPLQRVGTADEVASLVNYLCSDEASYIQGQVFSVNGGLAMS
ncbi:MAG TPA: 3-oxoacyl-ACP reductase FabG [Verrucomicrobia bacterium]|nr:MAG: 3-oxoacyl-ACP reductase [Lentisphaerae bacterium GWF2_57_35]HBA86374.1 3-oxoacyl-ACP reductase FabG [Verrucomicrobiota bacterium]